MFLSVGQVPCLDAEWGTTGIDSIRTIKSGSWIWHATNMAARWRQLVSYLNDLGFTIMLINGTKLYSMLPLCGGRMVYIYYQ